RLQLNQQLGVPGIHRSTGDATDAHAEAQTPRCGLLREGRQAVNVVFLSSRLPLTKTFAMTHGSMAAAPYPRVSKATSHHEPASTLADFHDLLVKHAALGHCLFRGQLTRPIKNESRAGLTDKTATQWVVFDFDKVPARDAAD